MPPQIIRLIFPFRYNKHHVLAGSRRHSLPKEFFPSLRRPSHSSEHAQGRNFTDMVQESMDVVNGMAEIGEDMQKAYSWEYEL
ncbi:hypothetical protein CDAR_238871 [Caerostris darwini]|uniref:Uncharacterized protein n=1 Tax=Caerostris darwini TaxID=1538125 RepID=A0AAV4PU66_9ARAC|nr:hypothetical protein CDAR_238871 [Caerostris darwini]